MNFIVWGGTQGIGWAIARRLIQDGHGVLAISRNTDHLKRVQTMEPAIHIMQGDIIQPKDREASISWALSRYATLDGLVINSGGPPKGTIQELSLKDFDEAYQLLMQSAIHLTLLALPHFQRQGGGRILYITSIAAKEPIPELILSSTMRAGILGFVKGASKTLAKENIGLYTIMPGYTKTERLKELYGSLDHPKLQKIVCDLPLQRWIAPEEIADFANYLLTKAPMALTGGLFFLDGSASKGY